MEENNDQIDESKRLKIDPDTQPEVAGNEPETKSLLAEIENVPVVNLDSSVESSGSREEQKAANNDKGRVVKWITGIVIIPKLRIAKKNHNFANKLGCVVRMVVHSILPHAERRTPVYGVFQTMNTVL